MAGSRGLLRSAAVVGLNALLIAWLPLIWTLRLLLKKPLAAAKLSCWTGAPILTLSLKCKAERSLGFKSFTVVSTTYHTTSRFDYVLNQGWFRAKWIVLPWRYLAFLAVCLTVRQVHAYFDGGLLPSLQARTFSRLELLAYRFLSIRLFVWTYGGDVRDRQATLQLGQPNCCTDCQTVGIACICFASKSRANISRVTRFATQTFAMGDMIEYVPGSRKDLFFWPIELDRDEYATYRPVFPEMDANRPLRVVHAPNHPQFKGTKYLVAAIEELRKDGLEIELVLVQGKSNQEALAIYRSADVIFDQCMIGFHGYFALEAMALGKPVMCFIRKPDLYLLAPEDCPIINTTNRKLKGDLRNLVCNRTNLERIGRQGRGYVEKYYSMEAFTARLGNAYVELGVLP
jgi:glycosyltransferase involved in cell wall biosynthesis